MYSILNGDPSAVSSRDRELGPFFTSDKDPVAQDIIMEMYTVGI